MAKLDGSERVLCLHAADIKSRYGPWTGWQEFRQEVIHESGWLSRTEELERNPQSLQVIAYGSVWRMVDGVPKVLVYRRAKDGSEGRLHGKLSLGIGGHVNLDDGPTTFDPDCYAMGRELVEELGVDLEWHCDLYKNRVGIIYDSSWTGVNAVHLGVYFEIMLDDYIASSASVIEITPESSVDIQGWWSHEDIRRQFTLFPDEWETWSQVVIRHSILRDLAQEPS